MWDDGGGSTEGGHTAFQVEVWRKLHNSWLKNPSIVLAFFGDPNTANASLNVRVSSRIVRLDGVTSDGQKCSTFKTLEMYTH